MNELAIPVPCFRVDSGYHILSATPAARAVFPRVARFSELLDAGSAAKAIRFITPSHGGNPFELNLVTLNRPAALFDLYQHWDDSGIGHLVCIERQSDLDVATGRLMHLREALAGGEFNPFAGTGQSLPPKADLSNEADIRGALEAIKALVNLLRPSLLELGKSAYADLIVAQAELALEQLALVPAEREKA